MVSMFRSTKAEPWEVRQPSAAGVASKRLWLEFCFHLHDLRFSATSATIVITSHSFSSVAAELRRLNTTSLALDACDALQRPVAGAVDGKFELAGGSFGCLQ